MLKSKLVQRLLRLLIALVGAGLGVAATLGGLQVYRWLNPSQPLEFIDLAISYIVTASIGALVFYLLSDRMIRRFTDACGALERYLDKLSTEQLAGSMIGLLAGMMVAALLSQILTFLGDSIFTTASSGILYVVLGLTGFSVGRRRGGDSSFADKFALRSFRRKGKQDAPSPKLLDASAIIDGRVLEVCRAGFLEGEVIIPAFIAQDIRHMADSADPSRRARGRRGVDMLQKLQDEEKLPLRIADSDYPDLTELDMKLLRLAQETGAAIVTCDQTMSRMAAVSGVNVLNLGQLANALRPVILPGEELTVQITKEGKEAHQGVGYLPDGTMIVVEGGRQLVGQTVPVTVTSALQTSAGRMIFARVKNAPSP